MEITVTLFSIRDWKRNGKGKILVNVNKSMTLTIVKYTGIARTQRESIHRRS